MTALAREIKKRGIKQIGGKTGGNASCRQYSNENGNSDGWHRQRLRQGFKLQPKDFDGILTTNCTKDTKMAKIVHFYYWKNYPTIKIGRIACMSGVTYHLSQSPIIKDVTCKKCLKIIKRKNLKEPVY